MLLKKIILENYGIFAGNIEFDLIPRNNNCNQKPIILFGGKNGSGKTTLLEAIRLVLYGKSVLGNRVSQDEYETFLCKQIYRGSKHIESPESSIIAIEFDHILMGERTTYRVERSWVIKTKNKVKESLKILKNNNEVKNVSPDYWRGFIEEIIPERLSQLFFFDGEKIKNIAADTKGSHVLAESIKILLGLDIVERLKADLTIYKSREEKQTLEFREDTELKKWDEKIGLQKKGIEKKHAELANIRSAIDGIQADINRREDRLQREGHSFAVNHDRMKNEKKRIKERIHELENKIRNECENTFPFSLCPSIVTSLKKQIQKEKKLQRWEVVKDELSNLQDEMLLSLTSSNKKIGDETVKDISLLIQSVIKSRIDITKPLKDVKNLHELSESDNRQIRQWSHDAEKSSKSVMKIGEELDSLIFNLQKITKELAKIPDEDQIKPIFEELAILNQRLGEFHHKKNQTKTEIKSMEYSLKLTERDKQKFSEKMTSKNSHLKRLNTVDTVQSILNLYLQKLTAKKIEQLRETVAECYNILSRKNDVIKSIDINPETFSVTLYDKTDNAIPKENLSSGEKQLYAIAMLWGLSKTSGRPLPVIIDTPLGRLDSDHRHNLIKNYFSNASHQVILLSTDTEVDQKLYHELSPSISHCFHLRYDEVSGNTIANEEYFWKDLGSCPN